MPSITDNSFSDLSGNIIVTGGYGFIGSAVIRCLLKKTNVRVINIDKLTYAANKSNLNNYNNNRYSFEEVDICDQNKIRSIFLKYQPIGIIHLAAESHVDNSIANSNIFIKTNILGTYNLLEETRFFLENSNIDKSLFRFHHISTDEVFGDLSNTKDLFTEESSYLPSSPYSASKASSDHLVRAWARTYNLPTIITNCSNNYGPYQFNEKLIPTIILNALHGKDLPIYGDGLQVRDWLYVEDHAEAILTVFKHGKVGDTYNIGGHNEKKNIEVVKTICNMLDETNLGVTLKVDSFVDLIKYINDRPGHDVRYAIDASKIQNDLGWVPKESFDTGIRKTVEWYLNNRAWWEKAFNKN